MKRKEKTTLPIFIFFLLIAAFLYAADSKRWLDPIRGYIEKKIVRLRVHHADEHTNPDVLSAKIFSLTQEIDVLTAENEDLRKQLQAPLSPQLRFAPSYVASVDRAIMKIASGSYEGIVERSGVVVESLLLGTVIKTTPHIAHVRLLSSQDSKIAVRTSRGAQGVLVGTDDMMQLDRALLDKVLRREMIVEGDTIFTSGEDGLPENLIVGTITALLSESRDPFQRAEVELAIDPREPVRVFVVSE